MERPSIIVGHTKTIYGTYNDAYKYVADLLRNKYNQNGYMCSYIYKPYKHRWIGTIYKEIYKTEFKIFIYKNLVETEFLIEFCRMSGHRIHFFPEKEEREVPGTIFDCSEECSEEQFKDYLENLYVHTGTVYEDLMIPAIQELARVVMKEPTHRHLIDYNVFFRTIDSMRDSDTIVLCCLYIIRHYAPYHVIILNKNSLGTTVRNVYIDKLLDEITTRIV